MNKILVVEDDMTQQYVMRVVLDSFNFSADIVSTGEKALECLNSGDHDYGLVLMDIRLPGMDGFECAKAIRKCQHESVSQIPIVAVTAYAGAEDRKQCIDSGMNDYISKPYELHVFKALIEQYLGREVDERPNALPTEKSQYNQNSVPQVFPDNHSAQDGSQPQEQHC